MIWAVFFKCSGLLDLSGDDVAPPGLFGEGFRAKDRGMNELPG
jgi:hypothetical protein